MRDGGDESVAKAIELALFGYLAQRPDSTEVFLVAPDHRGGESLKVAPVAGKLDSSKLGVKGSAAISRIRRV